MRCKLSSSSRSCGRKDRYLFFTVAPPPRAPKKKGGKPLGINPEWRERENQNQASEVAKQTKNPGVWKKYRLCTVVLSEGGPANFITFRGTSMWLRLLKKEKQKLIMCTRSHHGSLLQNRTETHDRAFVHCWQFGFGQAFPRLHVVPRTWLIRSQIISVHLYQYFFPTFLKKLDSFFFL